MFEKILVTTDGSLLGNLALPYAADLAWKFDSELVLLYVIPPLVFSVPFPDGTLYTHDDREEREQAHVDAERILREATQALNYPNVRVACLEAVGQGTAQTIEEAVEHEQAQLVVMSTHGRSGLAHLFLGSVAEQVLHRVKVPVFLVRAAATAATHPHQERPVAR